MRVVYVIVGSIMVFAGLLMLLGTSSAIGQISGLISWVIAAQLLTASSILEALKRLEPPAPKP